MATHYIGNVPSHGEFKKADSIVSSFNGTLTQFDLDYNTVNQTVGDATQLIVSLNGIVQEPGTAYTLGIGGGSVVFASAPASTDTCHIVLLGGVGGTTTPTDGSVTASKLDSNLKDYLEETFTADGTQTVFTLTRAVVGANTLLVTIDGIVQPSSAFTASGTTLTISEVLAATTNVRVVHMGVKAGVYVPADDSVTADMLANSINTDIASKLPLAGGTLTGNLGVTGTVTADAGSWSTVVSGNAITFDRNGENNIIADNGSSANLNLTAGNRIFYSADDYQSFKIGSSPTEKLRIRSTGIDVTGDITFGDNHAIVSDGDDNLVIESSSSEDVIIKAGSGVIEFRDAGESGSPLRAKIDTDGNLLVGEAGNFIATSTTATGLALTQEGRFTLSRSGTPMNIVRLGSEGSLIDFWKDGALAGRIGIQSTGLYMDGESGHAGLRFGSAAVVPRDNGSDSNGGVDLGDLNTRWKDLYLSGGVVFGTGGPSPITSNTLDDYEEGTFSPTMTLSTPGTSSFAYLAQSGQYRKVGNIVTFTLELRMNTISYGNGSGNLTIAGLPFNFANTGGYGSSLCNIMLYGGAISSGRTPFASGVSNTTNILLSQMGSSTATTTLVVSNYNTIQVSGTYITP